MGLVEKGFQDQYAEMKEGERPSLIRALDGAIRRRQLTPEMGCRVLAWVREDREEAAADALAAPATLQVVIGTEELGSSYIDYGVEDAA